MPVRYCVAWGCHAAKRWSCSACNWRYSGLIACVIGALLGWAGQHVLFYLLRGLIPDDLPPASLWPALAGMATGLVALAGFALPPLAALGRVPPLRVLRRDMLPVPASSWLVYGAALVALGPDHVASEPGSETDAGTAGRRTARCTAARRFAAARSAKPAPPAATRFPALASGTGPTAAAPRSLLRGQSLAFGLILLAMALIALLRGELLDTWQDQLPEDAPNHFALNVLPAERDAFAVRLAELSPHPAPLYPVVPGRLIMINDEPVRQLVTKESRGERAIQRDLSLTWAEQLPPDNQIIAAVGGAPSTPAACLGFPSRPSWPKACT
jgi:putative ABC transport system permease protein